MQEKGLTSFILVFFFILVYFSLVYSLQELEAKKNFTEAQLIEIENASFKRKLIEDSVDSIIKEEIEKEIAFGSDEPKKINKKISEKLAEFFSLMEAKGTEFKEIQSEKKYSEIKITGKKAGKEFIEENSKIVVINLKGKLYLVEFIYTAGINKDRLIGAKIKENSSEQKFFIPRNYSVKVIALRLV
ncbi:hypothetical protein KKG83_01785 [Candidatus Micrarchaeota archaeon]|nr:hypothetical protein [Candidatus Micrarchaeota archaeon]MBU2476180.1 hypothetical protein [Candidatus Micrarchaeota archaeon]